MTGLVLIWRGDREALGDVAGDGGDAGGIAVLEGEGSVGGELVGRGIVVADLDRDGGFGIFLIGVHVGRAQASDGGVGLIRHGGHGPALPVEGAVLEIWDLRGERWVDMQRKVRCESKT